MSSAPVKSTPKDAQVMTAILKDMGVNEYEPRLVNEMLEFTYRYVTDILDDAKVYSNHASKKNIDVEDVKLAIQCRLDHSFTTPPPRDLLMDVSRHKNNTSLPLIKPYIGPKLPPDRYCLASANYRLKSLKKPRVQSTGLQQSLINNPRINISSQGGVRAGQSGLSMLNPGLTIVNRPRAQPTVTIQRPATVAQTMSAPRPVIRLSAGLGGNSSQMPVLAAAPTLTSIVQNVNALKRKREEDEANP